MDFSNFLDSPLKFERFRVFLGIAWGSVKTVAIIEFLIYVKSITVGGWKWLGDGRNGLIKFSCSVEGKKEIIARGWMQT
jgi:hypothetical protein